MKFGNLYAIPSRNGLTKPRSVRGDGIKFVNMGELFENERIGNIEMDRVPVSKTEMRDALLQKDDLLFARQSLVREGAGKCSIITEVEEPTTFDSHLIRVRLNRSIANPNFYRYYFASPLSPMPGIVSQCAQAGIKGSDLKNLDVDCPPIEVQDKIASILGAYDELVENNRKQLRLLEEAVQRLYREWFIDLKFPGHETAPVIDGLPEGWQKGSLLDCVDFCRGKSYSSGDLVEPGELRLANLNSIAAYGGWTCGAEKPYTGKYKVEQLVSPGDVIMAVTDMTKERRLVGHVARVPKHADGFLMSMDLIKLVPKGVTGNYLYAALRFSGVAEMIAMLANGTNVLHLKPDALNRVSFVRPDYGTQKQFSAASESLFAMSEHLEQEAVLAREARDRLLPKLMTGEVKE